MIIDEIQNLLASVPQNPKVIQDLAYLDDILVIVWALLLGLTCLTVLHLLEKGAKRVEIWQLLWFSFIIALFCWVASRLPFMSPDILNRRAPAVGMIVAFALNWGLMLTAKQSDLLVTRTSVLIIPFALMAMSLCLLSPSLEIVTLPGTLLLRQTGVFLFFFLGCSLCTFFFSFLAVEVRFWDKQDQVISEDEAAGN